VALLLGLVTLPRYFVTRLTWSPCRRSP